MAEISEKINVTETLITSDTPKHLRPGRAYFPRPIEVSGKTFDPFHPPKTIRDPDGTQRYIGGREMIPDEVYAAKFWARKHPPGLREAMIETIRADAQIGTTVIFVDKSGITEIDKEKLSARRELAKELGFEVGSFAFNKNAFTATATIRPTSNVSLVGRKSTLS